MFKRERPGVADSVLDSEHAGLSWVGGVFQHVIDMHQVIGGGGLIAAKKCPQCVSVCNDLQQMSRNDRVCVVEP